jgi:hypothetical protein
MPKLVAAAIKFYPKDSEYPQIVCGKRHCDCFEWMFKHRVEYDKNTHEQGFLTNTNQFVDRYEAMNMALDWGQVSEEDGYESGQQLYSEDLW